MDFLVLTSPLIGALIDRIGPRKPYIAGLFVYAGAGAAGLVVDSFTILLASRAVLGIGVAFVYTGLTVLIYNLFTGDRKDRVMGLRGSANNLGAAVWPLIGGALGTLSWHTPFAVYALPLGLLVLFTVPEIAISRQGATDLSDPAGLRGLLAVFTATPLLLLVYGLYFAATSSCTRTRSTILVSSRRSVSTRRSPSASISPRSVSRVGRAPSSTIASRGDSSIGN